ncbi:MAG: SAM-dependent methyltransferase [Caldilineaceae bacterium]
MSQRQRFEQHYNDGFTPWDTRQTPPEVQRFWMSGRLPRRGLALDLGCGPGTNVTYLARLGLNAVGVDYVIQPLITAQARLKALAGAEPWLPGRVRLVLGDVTNLAFSGLGAHYILDVGCLHGIPPEARPGYFAGVLANLAPGGYYHLYAFDRVPELEQDPDRIRGMLPNEVAGAFAPALEVVTVDQARPDRYPCKWYLLRRAA